MSDEEKKPEAAPAVPAGRQEATEKKEETKTESSSASTSADATADKEAKADKEKSVEVPSKFKSIVEEIEKMSVLDLSELVKVLEDKFGVSAAAPVAMAQMPGVAADTGVAAEEKDSFNVELTSTGESKINVIKAIRAVTQIGLKEAKDMAEGAPVMVKEAAKKEEAEDIKKQLEEAGASVTLK